MDQIRAYPFGLENLLKSPSVLRESTRSPVPFKTNSNQALFYSLRPLSFPRFEPAVHPWLFHVLAPESFQFLHLGPRFFQKTPGNSVFLAEKPLDLVFALVFAL